MTDLVQAEQARRDARIRSDSTNGDENAGRAGTRTRVVLDTSVLIADPMCVYSFGDNDVVVPLTVIEELDELKTRPDDVGRAARSALRTLEELRVRHGGSLAEPVPVGDGTIRIEINGIQKHLLIEHGLDPNVPDNRIIGAALGQAAQAHTIVVSNDAALRIKAAHLGVAAMEHQPSRRACARPIGWSVIESTYEVIDCLYAAGAVTVAAVDTAATIGENEFVVLRSGSQSALARRVDDEFVLLPHSVPEAWGLRPRGKEQRFALELLLDPDIAVVALDGRAGTGKTLLAIAAGLEQVVEKSRYERVAVYRPLVPVGRADVGFLPGGLDEKLDPWMSAIHDAIVALSDHGSSHDAAPPDRRADVPRAAVDGVGDVPARPVAAPPDGRDRRSPEPRTDDVTHDPHPYRRGHQGGVHRRHQPDRRAVPRRIEQRPRGAHQRIRRAALLRPRHPDLVRAQRRGQPRRRVALNHRVQKDARPDPNSIHIPSGERSHHDLRTATVRS